MKECVIVDGVRTANVRAHPKKGWFRNLRPEVPLKAAYTALFARNPQVNPENIDAVFCGTANQAGMQNDIARLGWLAGGFPESIPTNGIGQQCPSGMAAAEHAARAIMCGEGEIYVVSGVEDMEKANPMFHIDFSPLLADRYNMQDLLMGSTAEKVAAQYSVSRVDQENFAFWSHRRAHEATEAGKFANEIIPVEGHDDEGNTIIVDRDQWVRPDISMDQMAAMKPAYREDGVVTAATSSPITAGACAMLLMSREKADELGMKYHLAYAGGVMAGCDPTVMGMGPLYAARKLLAWKGMTINDIDVWELNEAFGSQSLAVLRELGLGENAPFENVNVWGGALALGHPLGQSGARIIITLNNIMQNDYPDATYGVAMLCGGFGNANASLWKNVKK
ncbi:MAG: thiolase family protein [Deltaproteobacteria bacterium]|nr:thiolase family protein [Deltaproteobacteria bacterium]